MRKTGIYVVILSLLALAGCGPTPGSASLREAFFSQIAALHGISELDIGRNSIAFEYRGDAYTCTPIAIDIEPIDDERYTHIGSLECAFTVNGEPLEYFEHLYSAGIEPDAIVAAWDNELKRWRFDIEFE